MKNFIVLMLLTFNVFGQSSRTQFFETWSTKKANQNLILAPTGTGSITSAFDFILSGTGQIQIPLGTTAQRSGTPAAGMFRFNSTLTQFEGYDGVTWGAIGGGGGSSLDPRLVNGSFEDSTALSPADGWTYTPSGADVAEVEETAVNVVHEEKAVKITPDAETFSFLQQVNVDALAGNLVGFNIWVKADFDLEVCAIRDSVELSCETYTADSGYKEFITLQDAISGKESGIKVKSDSSVTGTAYFDYGQFKASPLATAQLYASNKYEQYTPTIQGMTGGSSISFFWKRVGDSIIIMADMTTGAAQSLEIQLGLPSGLTIDSSKVTTIMNVGSSEENNSGTDNFTILATGGDSFLNMGARGGSLSAGLTPQTDTTLFGSGRQINFITQPIPITGWLETKQGVVVKGIIASDIVNENTFSATVDNGAGSGCSTGTCTVTNEGLNWINDVDYAGTTGKYNVNFNLGVFTSIPNCHAEPVTVNVGRQCRVENQSISTVTVECEDNSDAVENNVFTLMCDRGDDKVLESEKTIVFPDGIAPKTCYYSTDVSFAHTVEAATASYKQHDIVSQSGSGCNFGSLSSSSITLGSGTYKYEVGVAGNNATSWVSFRIFDGTSAVVERARVAYSGVDYVGFTSVVGEFTLSSAATLQMQTQALSASGDEYLSDFSITKVR